MAMPSLHLLIPQLILCVSMYIIAGTAESHVHPHQQHPAAAAAKFLQDSCRVTRYPALCARSLSTYANAIGQSPYKLTSTALNVSLAMAEATKANMLKLTSIKGLKPAEYGTLKDCLDQIQESVDQLSNSVREIEQLERSRGEMFVWYKGNFATWVSAALTQADTCAQGFSSPSLNGKIKAAVQGQVTDVEQQISNALALFNQYASQHCI